MRTSRLRSVLVGVAWVLVLTMALSGLAAEHAAAAREFVELFLEDAFDRYQPRMAEQMAAAFPESAARQTRAALVGQNGSVEDIGDAWHEDDVQGYRRYRVPVRFENATLDLRVVLDDDGKVAGFFVVPHIEAPDPDSPVQAPVAEEDVVVGDEHTGLPGTLSLPPGDGPFPAVVLVHGSGPNDRDETVGQNKPFRDVAWGLAQRGVVVLRYDKRSFARPEDLVAVGDGLTVRHEAIDDAVTGLALLRKDNRVHSEQVFVLGHSLGGTIAPRIAEISPRPAGMIIMAGSVLPLPETMLGQVRYIAMLGGRVTEEQHKRIDDIAASVETIRKALDGDAPSPEGEILGAPFGYYLDLDRHDPPAEAAKLGLPVLVLQGARDYQVTMKDFELWQGALDGKPFACLRVYDGMDHLFRKGTGVPGPHDYERKAEVDPEVVDDIAAWVTSRTCPSAATE